MDHFARRYKYVDIRRPFGDNDLYEHPLPISNFRVHYA
jgi:hypothetical protein